MLKRTSLRSDTGFSCSHMYSSTFIIQVLSLLPLSVFHWWRLDLVMLELSSNFHSHNQRHLFSIIHLDQKATISRKMDFALHEIGYLNSCKTWIKERTLLNVVSDPLLGVQFYSRISISFNKMLQTGTGMMSYWLSVLALLVEDPVSIISTRIRWCTTNTICRYLIPTSCLYDHSYTFNAHTYTQIHTWKIN